MGHARVRSVLASPIPLAIVKVALVEERCFACVHICVGACAHSCPFLCKKVQFVGDRQAESMHCKYLPAWNRHFVDGTFSGLSGKSRPRGAAHPAENPDQVPGKRRCGIRRCGRTRLCLPEGGECACWMGYFHSMTHMGAERLDGLQRFIHAFVNLFCSLRLVGGGRDVLLAQSTALQCCMAGCGGRA